MLTTSEAAERLSNANFNAQPEDIARLAGLGLLPGAKKAAGVWQIPEEAVESLIAQKRARRRLKLGAGTLTAVALLFAFVSAAKDGIDLLGFTRGPLSPTAPHQTDGTGRVSMGTAADKRGAVEPYGAFAVGLAGCSGSGFVFSRGGELPNAHDVANNPAAAGVTDALVPRTDGTILVELVVSSKEEKTWARVSNVFSLSIAMRSLRNDDWSTLESGGGCGAGETRDFPVVSLTPWIRETTVRYDSAEYFSLQPGEFEDFSLHFRCRQPGEYNVTISIPYQIGDDREKWNKQVELVCPRTMTKWTDLGDGPLHRDGVQRWSWGQYSFERA